MKARLVVLAVLALTSSARADVTPRWYEQFYAYSGYRHVAGVDRASSRSWGIGYRFERTTWGLDLAVLGVQNGMDEGLHQVARVTAYRNLSFVTPRLWVGGGGSYGFVKGWTDTSVPRRGGHGFELDAVAGYDLPKLSFVRPFLQLGVTVPMFTARDRYGSMDSAVRVIGVELALGIRL